MSPTTKERLCFRETEGESRRTSRTLELVGPCASCICLSVGRDCILPGMHRISMGLGTGEGRSVPIDDTLVRETLRWIEEVKRLESQDPMKYPLFGCGTAK